MPFEYKFQFGEYVLPSTIRPDGESWSQDTAPVERPRAAGAHTQPGRRSPTLLTARGELTADTAEELADIERDLKLALQSGKQPLWFGRSDRYYKAAQLKSFSTASREGMTYGVVTYVSLTFEAADQPYEVDCVENEETIVGASDTLTIDATQVVLPTWTLTIGSGGTGPITIANTTRGETMTIGNATDTIPGGSVIVLQRDGYLVTLDGDEDFSLLDGVIPSLSPGDNTITKAAGGTATIASLELAYQNVYG